MKYSSGGYMKCPYCGTTVAKTLDHALLVKRHRAMVDFVADGGPRGIEREKFVQEFFKPTNSQITVRTTLNRINRKIGPLRITSLGGILRLG